MKTILLVLLSSMLISGCATDNQQVGRFAQAFAHGTKTFSEGMAEDRRNRPKVYEYEDANGRPLGTVRERGY